MANPRRFFFLAAAAVADLGGRPLLALAMGTTTTTCANFGRCTTSSSPPLACMPALPLQSQRRGSSHTGKTNAAAVVADDCNGQPSFLLHWPQHSSSQGYQRVKSLPSHTSHTSLHG
eukprot:m.67226 g.67226  ORF g.67226 m.67226 type:complete len:117 (+) comp14100_c4_seq2:34-384(+)